MLHRNDLATREYEIADGVTATVRDSTLFDAGAVRVMFRKLRSVEAYQSLPTFQRDVVDEVVVDILGAMARTTGITGDMPCFGPQDDAQTIFDGVMEIANRPRTRAMGAWLNSQNAVFANDPDLLPPEDVPEGKDKSPPSSKSGKSGGNASKETSESDTTPSSAETSTVKSSASKSSSTES
jgi:hypothetical protein